MTNDTLIDIVFGPETFVSPNGDEWDHDIDADISTISADLALLNVLLFFNLRCSIAKWETR
jgi:hypothetical protein